MFYDHFSARSLLAKLGRFQIDEDVIILMNDIDLRTYLPEYGDREAVKAF